MMMSYEHQTDVPAASALKSDGPAHSSPRCCAEDDSRLRAPGIDSSRLRQALIQSMHLLMFSGARIEDSLGITLAGTLILRSI